MEELIRECVEQPVWAVVGYSDNRRKYGNLIFHDLQAAGYVVFPVNRRGGRANGFQVYPSVRELPVKPGVVDIVVPPPETLKVIQDCLDIGIERVWMQPGAESDQAIQLCEDRGLKAVYHACAMVEKLLLEG